MRSIDTLVVGGGQAGLAQNERAWLAGREVAR